MSTHRPKSRIFYLCIAIFFVSPVFAFAQTTPSIVSAYMRVLHIGDRGADVVMLQKNLNTIMGTSTPIPVTGYFGAMTEHSVRRFQEHEGIIHTGDHRTTGYGGVGPRTRDALTLAMLTLRCTWQTKPSRQACLEDFYEKYTTENGTTKALRLIAAHVLREQYFDGSCHAEMHEIGHVAAREYKTLGVAFMHGTDLCQNGYYHGVVEEYLRERPILSVTPEELRGFCADASTRARTKEAALNCVHGVGHALVYMTQDDLPKALLRCFDFVTDTEKGECVSGAFMQDSFVGSSAGLKTQALQDLTSRCSQALFDGGHCWLAEAKKVIAGTNVSTSTAEQ